MSLRESGIKANAGYRNYTFWQNNSGGYYIGPTSFTVTAQSEIQAFSILADQPFFSDVHCECCGPRWGICVEEREL